MHDNLFNHRYSTFNVSWYISAILFGWCNLLRNNCDIVIKVSNYFQDFERTCVSSGRDKYLVSRIYLETWQQLLLSINRICEIEIHNDAQCFNNCIAWTNLWISHILTGGTDFKRNIMFNAEYLSMMIYLAIDTAHLMWHDIYLLFHSVDIPF